MGEFMEKKPDLNPLSVGLPRYFSTYPSLGEFIGLGELKLVHADADCAIGAAGNMLFMVWHVHTMAPSVLRAKDAMRQMAVSNPRGLGVMQVVDERAEPPDTAARKALSEFIQAGEHCVKHYSVLHEGSGFKAAAVRAIVSTLYLLDRQNRPKFPYIMSNSLSESAMHHSKGQRLLGLDTPARTITEIISELRRVTAMT